MKMPDEMSGGSGAQYYATRLGTYDEMQATAGAVLPHWGQLLKSLAAFGGQGLARRRQEAERLLRENGVTYNVYNDPEGNLRPWQLDPIPLLLGSEEWLRLERGLQQRAELLDRVLADLYGEQALIRDGLLPLELVHCHAGFQRSCVGVPVMGGRHLVLYAANLARGPEGRMWVLDDRSQAPSGAGYALENRTVMTRILPGLFRDAQIQRLAQFFRSLRLALARLAPHNRDDPRVVVLTPGPFNETYFEQAYLAAYLGYPLAQGDDLTVRDGRVWLKSLEGLQQVDVILRRLDDSFCDPLELRSDSLLGVPGLVEAVRRGHVAIANPIGSSLLENPGFLPFLPGIARHLLGAELELPAVATWWCGQPREREFVLANLGELVIKTIHRTPGKSSVFGGSLDQAGLALWRERIRAKPHMYVGQERISFSTVPSLVGEGVEPRHAILRTFLVAREQDYLAMPGGLTRIAPAKESFSVSGQSGGVSKDTWVLVDEVEMLSTTAPAPESPGTVQPMLGPLPSRSADNLFWVGRYTERAESSARLVRTILNKLDEQQEIDDPGDAICLEHLLRAVTHLTSSYPGFVGAGSASRLSQPLPELRSLLLNEQRPGSLPGTLVAFSRAAFTVRDLWSNDAWRVVDEIQQQWRQVQSWPPGEAPESLQDSLDQLILKLVAFSGLTTESMAHDSGWLLLDIGRRLERAKLTTALLRATLVSCHHPAVVGQVLEAVLATTESLVTFRRRYRSHLQLPAVLELLLLDEKHPRALAYQLRKLQSHIAFLPKSKAWPTMQEDERLVLEAFTRVRLANVTRLATAAESDIFADLDDLLDGVTSLLAKLSDALTRAYFSHAQGPRLLAADPLEVEL
ncbi:hypothetical protein DBW_2407 [Desulfuromonas sp. DDH964]|uniref:circularly permuted type 2 ATP-grasp protein n=1 Tax=Desulfuromonas sp. DDH964 TaxID=1823759 RepID=UPI00078B1E4C|nr:circularly permuted type 2 ATP-grasp protein [Desulfuromonas sp. DDH964]AMV72744.1 hypothetical protein DBW_2407 [Desulfuromonas sp. DDH964]